LTPECRHCDCKKFEPETDLEKLRKAFNGEHSFSMDFEHDARIYVTALEFKFAQAVSIAQINIKAGAECKKELDAARDRVRALERQIETITGTPTDAD
jgi:hypothetical protein